MKSRKIVHCKGRILIFVAHMLCGRYSVGICIYPVMLRATLGSKCYDSHFTDKGAESKNDLKV